MSPNPYNGPNDQTYYPPQGDPRGNAPPRDYAFDPRNDGRGLVDPRSASGPAPHPNDPRNDPRTDPRNNAGPSQGAPREADGDMLPEGEYRVKCIKHQYGRSSKKKTPQIGLRLQIIEGAHKGKTLLWYGYITPNAEQRTIESMQHLGFKGDDIFVADSMHEGEAIAVVEHERDENGKLRVKCAWINSLDVGMTDVLEGRDLEDFRRHMKATINRIKGTSPSTSRGSIDGPAPGQQQGYQQQPYQPQQSFGGPPPGPPTGEPWDRGSAPGPSNPFPGGYADGRPR